MTIDTTETNNYIKNLSTGELVFFNGWGTPPEVKIPFAWAAWRPYVGMPTGMKLIGYNPRGINA